MNDYEEDFITNVTVNVDSICGLCGYEELVIIADFDDVNVTERQMGNEIEYLGEHDWVCPRCGFENHIEAHVWEYPRGAYDSHSALVNGKEAHSEIKR